jgi:hypothetical protein
VVDPLNGAVTMYRNGGPGSSKWIWYPVTQPIASGVDSNGAVIRFADITGDGRADYLRLSMGNAAIDMWYNGCSSSTPPPATGPPAVPDDPIHPYGDGTICAPISYDDIDDFPGDLTTICFIISSLETYSRQLTRGIEEFGTLVTEEWDDKFGIYAKHFTQVANLSVIAYNRDHAHEWFDCEVAERIYCCNACEFVVEPDHTDRCKYCVSRGDEGVDDSPCRPNAPSDEPPFYFRNEKQGCPPDYGGRGVGGNARQSVFWTL